MVGDFAIVGITRVEQLKKYRPESGAESLYERLCAVTGARHDPCVIDAFAAAIAQARDPALPKAQCDWWYWTGIRKAREKAAPLGTMSKRNVKSR